MIVARNLEYENNIVYFLLVYMSYENVTTKLAFFVVS